MVHLYCNSNLVQLSDVESIKLTSRFTDLQTFQTTGSFSQTFRVPYEPNISIFGALFSVNVVLDNNYMFKKLPAEIRVNTIPVHVGYVRVMRVIRQKDIITDLELNFNAETPDLVKSLGSKKLKDLAALSTLNHEINIDTVTNTAYDYRYILADRGHKFSELGEAGTRPIYDLTNPIYPAELTPCIFWSWLFQNIIEEAGFTLDATDLMTILEGYVMPFVVDKAIKYDQAVESYFFRAGYTTDQSGVSQGLLSGMSEQFDNNGNFASSIYTAPHSGNYTFRVFANVTPQTGAGPYVQFRFINTVSGYNYPGTPFNYAPTVGTTYNFVNDVTFFLHEGDTIQLKLITTWATVKLEGHSSYADNLATGWALIGFDGVLYGQNIDFAKNAPDMTQLEFVKDVIQMHNCAVIPDRSIPGKIKIEPLSTYIGSGNALDWTGKVDLSKDIVISPTVDMQKNKLTFTYKEGGDVWNKLYKDKGRIYGEYIVQGYTVSENEESSDFAIGDTKVELVTQPTPCNAINGTSVIVPKFMNADGNFVVPGPRCLFLAGTTTIALYNNEDEEAQLLSVYLGNHYSTILAEADDYDLNWAPETPPHEIIANPYNNLFNTYWRPYLNGIYSEQARMMECHVALNLADAINTTFADRIFIKDAWWRLLEMNEYVIGGMESTKVTLIKIIDTIPDCEMTPVGVLFDGKVVFHDGSGTEVTPTSACCTRYGYTFSGTDCYAFGYRPGDHSPGGLINPGSSLQPNFILALASRLDVQPSNIMSLAVGRGITVPVGNEFFAAVGDELTMVGENRGGAMFGKNVRTNMPGFHLGGGWTNDDREQASGSAQVGTVIMTGNGTLTTKETEIELFIEGVSSKRINLEDKTGMSCILTVNMVKVTTGAIAAKSVAQFSFYINKTTTAAAGTIVDILKVSDFVSPELVIDTSTDTSEHRIKLKSNGTGYPHSGVYFVASLQYTQFRHE